jgi:hypothetical protein
MLVLLFSGFLLGNHLIIDDAEGVNRMLPNVRTKFV